MRGLKQSAREAFWYLIGRTPLGVRGLKLLLTVLYPARIICRTPPGVRGLKPSLGRRYGYGGCGRTPPGVRGLKPTWEFRYFTSVSRTPPGVRGLKHEMNANLLLPLRSHPAQGAWIET